MQRTNNASGPGAPSGAPQERHPNVNPGRAANAAVTLAMGPAGTLCQAEYDAQYSAGPSGSQNSPRTVVCARPGSKTPALTSTLAVTPVTINTGARWEAMAAFQTGIVCSTSERHSCEARASS
ncbi:MAG TPA: hypothetical protein VGB85_24790 [Nannocystis sp.]